ncbi:hypothetical protein GOP47_0005343 [Adiantum capillus-veneris]|uniref:Uncharacterized protein n=1 Tax=Adiantum capillus-veneris TaxID=13818 RepID=A0A9D4V5D2_ADICA|nr:hypothetical protein GOP47_0005343 [Adiantum capillus-veneris]
MVRCEKQAGLKKGPWTPEEDQKLKSYIETQGHSSWRALPKQAGLARCGKSCRLRWTNYLRPGIKRGNFSVEEENSIIQLHAVLGNRSLHKAAGRAFSSQQGFAKANSAKIVRVELLKALYPAKNAVRKLER